MSDTNSQFERGWSTSGGENSRRGLFAGAVQPGHQPLRRLPAQGAVQAAVVFDSQGRAYVADMAGGVEAFTDDGRRIWEQRLTGGISATPAIDPDGGLLFVGTHTGWIYALAAANGNVVWKKEIPTKSDARILSDLLYLPRQKTVVLSSWGGRFHLLDARSGEVTHSWDAGISPSAGAMADDDEMVYCVRTVWPQGVQCVRISAEGKETILFEQPGKHRPANRLLVAAAPVWDARRKIVYLVVNSDREAALHAWSAASAKLMWKYQFSAAVGATPAVANDGTIVVADMAGFVHALAPDGSTRYRYATGCEYLLAGGVCDNRGVVFIGDPLGMIHCIQPNGLGQPIFEAPRAIQARPSFHARGNLFVPATDRQVYVFANQDSVHDG